MKDLTKLHDFCSEQAEKVYDECHHRGFHFCTGVLDQRIVEKFNDGESTDFERNLANNLAEMYLKPFFPV